MRDVIITLFPIIILTVFFGLLFSDKKKREALKKLSTCLSGSISKFSFYPTFNGEYQGLKFSIVLIPANRNSPDYLKIHLIKNSFFKLRIYKESTLSQIGKKLRIIHEVKINDEVFDREFLIFSNHPNQALNYLSNINIKNAIRQLFNNGFIHLLIGGRKVSIQKPNYILEYDLEPNRVLETLQKLGLLVTGL